MNDDILYTGLVDSANLTALITACAFSPAAFFLGEQLPPHIVSMRARQDLLHFIQFTPEARDIDFASYTTGRVFQHDAELRWEKRHNSFQVVYLGAKHHLSATTPDTFALDKRNILTPHFMSLQLKHYYLFGTRIGADDRALIGKQAQDGDFAEVRIHRLLRYPHVNGNPQRLCLYVQEYCDQKTGQVMLFRFQGLEKGEGKNNESL